MSRRTREIGLRVALGARGADVVRLVVKECLLFAAVGLAVGTAAALALAGLLEGVLFEVTPRDPVTLVGIALLFAAAAAAAAWIPARAALAIDPAEALRAE